MATIAAAVTHWQFLISRLLTNRRPVQLTRFRALDIIEPHSFLSPDAIMGRRGGITAISRRIRGEAGKPVETGMKLWRPRARRRAGSFRDGGRDDTPIVRFDDCTGRGGRTRVVAGLAGCRTGADGSE